MSDDAGSAHSQPFDPEDCLQKDPKLRAELQCLFRNLDGMDSHPWVGNLLGDFKVLSEIGSGGTAVVFEAEQISTGRMVALKVLPAYQNFSKRMVKKFLREVEAACRQNHPGIVAVYAVGESAGMHFIAQELVGDGRSLAHEIERLKERGDLPQGYFRKIVKRFIGVAAAMRHAHEVGVIHCDLKPSNLLITPEGSFKVSDFGMARVEGALVLTRTHDFSGTLYYMSPEQATGRRADVDQRSDVYSLGVTLFECLTLTHPFESPNAHTLLKKILQDEPPDPHKLNPRVPRDLSTLCLKAMDKDPARRYPSMEAFSDDLKRFLTGEDIEARPAGFSTRLARRIRRNPALSGLAAMTIVSVIALALYVFWSYPQILRERDVAMKARAAAENEAEKVNAVNRFLHGMFESPRPGVKGRDVKVADVLDRADREARVALAGQPETEAALRSTLAGTYYRLGMYEESAEQFKIAIKIQTSIHGDEHEETLGAMSHLATTYSTMGDYEKSRKLFEKVIHVQERMLGDEDPDTLQSKHNLATTLIRLGKLDAAADLLSRVYDCRARILGDDHEDTLASLGNLGTLLMDQGRYAEAEKYLRRIMLNDERALGEEEPDTIGSYVNLANSLTAQKKFVEAEPLARKGLKLSRKVMGEDHPKTFIAESSLGSLLMERGDYPEAENMFKDVLERFRRVYGEGNPNSLVPSMDLGHILTRQGKFQEAGKVFARTNALADRLLPKDHFLRASLYPYYGEFLIESSRFEEAEKILVEALGLCEATFGSEGEETRETVRLLVRLYERWGKSEKAAAYRKESARAQ